MKRTPKQYWDIGTRFCDAWTLVATPDQADRIRSWIDAGEPSGPIFDGLSAILAFRSDIPTTFVNEGPLKTELDEDVLTHLYNEELLAIGQPDQHSTSRRYDFIPHEFWDYADADWNSNRAYKAEKSFRNLRVVDPYAHDELASKRKQGRPSYYELTELALKSLFSKGFSLDGPTNKEVNHSIFNELELIGYDVPYGYRNSDESTFRRHLKKFKLRNPLLFP